MATLNIYIITTTTNLTIYNYNYFIVDATSGNITITLPAIYQEGMWQTFHRKDATTNTVTIASPDTITGPVLILPGAVVQYVSWTDNTWYPASTYSYGSAGSTFGLASNSAISMTTIAGGLVGNIATVGACGSAGSLTLVGGLLNLASANNLSFAMPRDGYITAINYTFSLSAAVNFIATTVTVTAQLFTANANSNSFSALTGSDVNMSPTLSGSVAIGTVSTGSLSNLNLYLARGKRVLLVVYITASGINLINTVNGYLSGGVNIV